MESSTWWELQAVRQVVEALLGMSALVYRQSKCCKDPCSWQHKPRLQMKVATNYVLSRQP